MTITPEQVAVIEAAKTVWRLALVQNIGAGSAMHKLIVAVEALVKSEGDTAHTEPEGLVSKQVRLVLEQQCHDIAVKLKAMVPGGVGFTLFLLDYGPKGNLAYVSTVDRYDMIRTITEWLGRVKGEGG